MRSRRGKAIGILLFCLFAVGVGLAQKLKQLAAFDVTNGYYAPNGSLIMAAGDFYGSTQFGGGRATGTIFHLTPEGALTTIYEFCSLANCADGQFPTSITFHNGKLYGATQFGGGGNGTVFEMTLDGKLTTLHNFSYSEGADPLGAPVFFQGNLYGATQSGGASQHGAIYKIDFPSLTFSTIHNFCSQPNCTDGDVVSGQLTPTKYQLWGATTYGGSKGFGTVFRVSSTGAFTTVHNFKSSDGAGPIGTLLLASDGNLYGTTYAQGVHGNGSIYEVRTSGTFTKLYDFCAQDYCTDGAVPFAGLIEDSEGSFYGTTFAGGNAGLGTIFQFSAGVVTTLHTFTGPLGARPMQGLVQGSNGAFYGTTNAGGGSSSCSDQIPVGCGSVFALWK